MSDPVCPHCGSPDGVMYEAHFRATKFEGWIHDHEAEDVDGWYMTSKRHLRCAKCMKPISWKLVNKVRSANLKATPDKAGP